MRRPPLLVTITLLLLSTGVLTHAADDFLVSRFSDYVDALRTQAGIPGLAAAIVGPTSVTWEAAFGQQDVERNVAVRTDTPFQLDGTTQIFVAALALRCAQDGRLNLDDRVAEYAPSSPDAGATIRQLLTHTTPGPSGLTFSYRPDRLAPVAAAVSKCTESTFRWGVGHVLEQLTMIDAIPGTDVVNLTAPQEQFTASALTRYSDALRRLAVPYAVDARRRATRSSYLSTALTPGSGLIASLKDLEEFDLGLKTYFILDPDWLAGSWSPPFDGAGARLPHAYGWFVQLSNGERIVWQFGVGENASSSMVILLPRRGLTLILLANSHGLVRPFPLAEGDITVSPFARLFLSMFAR
jgi:CubicO group peptidase (beta-lactamase class C family)